MPKLGLVRSLTTSLAVTLSVACKAAPEPTPAEASAPTTERATDAPPAATPAATPAEASAPATSATGPAGADAPLAAGAPRLYGDATKSITAKAGERFGVALPSNVTLPYKWRLDPPDAKVLALTNEKQVDQPPPGCGDCVGYGGARLYSFEAKGAGATSLHFSLKPLTDPKGAAQKDVTIAVTVTP
jgi:predicted secreted protein